MRKVLAVSAVLIGFSVSGFSPAQSADLTYKAPPLQYQNWYFEARIGAPINAASSSAFEFSIPALALPGANYSPRTGFYGTLTAGRYFAPNWRYELEFAYGYAADGFAAGAPHTGSLSSYGLMANVIYDFKNASKLTPFVGAGLGAQIVSLNNLSGGAVVANDTDVTFAASVIAGLDYRWTRSWTLTARYTGLYTGGMSFATNFPATTVERDNGWLNLVTVGLRYQW